MTARSMHPASDGKAEPGQPFPWLSPASPQEEQADVGAGMRAVSAERRHDFVMGLRVQLVFLLAQDDPAKDALQRWFHNMKVPSALVAQIRQRGAVRAHPLFWNRL